MGVLGVWPLAPLSIVLGMPQLQCTQLFLSQLTFLFLFYFILLLPHFYLFKVYLIQSLVLL